jgi:hypothetical protein
MQYVLFQGKLDNIQRELEQIERAIKLDSKSPLQTVRDAQISISLAEVAVFMDIHVQACISLLPFQNRIADLKKCQEQIVDVVSKGNDLQRTARDASRAAIGDQLDALNKRWSDLNTEAEEKQAEAVVSLTCTDCSPGHFDCT